MLAARLRFPLGDHELDLEINFIVNDDQYEALLKDYSDMRSTIRQCASEELERRHKALSEDMGKHCKHYLTFDTSKCIRLVDEHVIIDFLKLVWQRLTKFKVSHITAKFYMLTPGSEEGQKYSVASVSYFFDEAPALVIPAGTVVVG